MHIIKVYRQMTIPFKLFCTENTSNKITQDRLYFYRRWKTRVEIFSAFVSKYNLLDILSHISFLFSLSPWYIIIFIIYTFISFSIKCNVISMHYIKLIRLNENWTALKDDIWTVVGKECVQYLRWEIRKPEEKRKG